MEKNINEEIRQYKLFKIQETEAKLRKFRLIYTDIKEHSILKFSKNASSNLLRIVFLSVGLLFFLLWISCFFPEQITSLLEKNNTKLSISEKQELASILSFCKYLFFGLSLFFEFISYLLKINNQKRNTIYALSKLTEEVMMYLENTSFEEKRKYEYFVDNLSSKESNNPS